MLIDPGKRRKAILIVGGHFVDLISALSIDRRYSD